MALTGSSCLWIRCQSLGQNQLRSQRKAQHPSERQLLLFQVRLVRAQALLFGHQLDLASFRVDERLRAGRVLRCGLIEARLRVLDLRGLRGHQSLSCKHIQITSIDGENH
jgi:hypothetical protein